MHDLQDNHLFADVYHCIQQPAHWVSVLDRVKVRMKVVSVAVQILKTRADGSVGLEWEARDSFSLEHSALHDKWVNNADNPRLLLDIQHPLQVVRDDDVFKPDCPVFRRFLERLACAGLGKAIMLDIALSDDTLLSLVAHRHSQDERPYGTEVENFLYALAPHLTQVFHLAEQFNRHGYQQALLEKVVDQLATGLLLIDHRAKVLWGSSKAKAMVEKSIGLTIHNQTLRFLNMVISQSFRDILSQMTHQTTGFERHILVLQEDGINALEIMLVPVADQGALPCLLVYLKEMAVASIDPREVQMTFSLTPAEANVAVAIAEGLTLSEYAIRKGIAIGTARIQLKSVFSKMSVNRQADLVRKLWTSISVIPVRTQ